MNWVINLFNGTKSTWLPLPTLAFIFQRQKVNKFVIISVNQCVNSIKQWADWKWWKMKHFKVVWRFCSKEVLLKQDAFSCCIILTFFAHFLQSFGFLLLFEYQFVGCQFVLLTKMVQQVKLTELYLNITLSSIYDGAFLGKQITTFNRSLFL